MHLLCIALTIFAATVAILTCIALLPARWARASVLHNFFGPCALLLGCAVGFVAVCTDFFTPQVGVLPWALPLGSGAVGLDAASRIFLMPIFGLGFVCTLAGALHVRHCPSGEHNIAAHWLFFTLLIMGLTLVCIARDAVLFVFAWEVMSVAPFFLIEFYNSDAKVRDASWVYLVAAHVGGLFLLAFFALLWQATGSTAFAAFAIAPASGLGTALFVLGLCAFGMKAGLTPLHIWLPAAHPVAPSHVSALLSGAVINAGIYGLWRMLDFFEPLSQAPAWWGWTLIALGLGTGFVGIFRAMAQNNLKRLLAYSSVENMGIVTAGLGAGLVGLHAHAPWICLLGFGGALYHMCNHSIFKGLLFLCAGEVLHTTRTVQLHHLGGLQKRLPFVGAAFAVGTASIACLPPFNGFVGEFLLALALAGGLNLPATESALGLLLALTALIAVSAFAAATFTKAYGIAFLGEPRTPTALAAANAHTPDRVSLMPLALLVPLCLLLGLAGYWVFPILLAALPAAALDSIADAPALTAKAAHLLLRVAAIGAGVMALAALVLWVRSRILRGDRRPDTALTWGCGFQKGTARIQYSAASFSEPLAQFFSVIMGLRVRSSMNKEYFPARATLEVDAPDRIRTRFLSPALEAVERLCNALKIIQHGRVHLYILYMLLTVVSLLIWALHEGGAA